MLNVTIDGIKVQVKEGSTILQAAQSVGIKIPTLCYLKDLTRGFLPDLPGGDRGQSQAVHRLLHSCC